DGCGGTLPCGTCPAHATCQQGVCRCNSGFNGANCQYSDATTCNGHGAAQMDGSCLCTTAFTGPSCNQCAANYYSYPTCTVRQAATTCSEHGTCGATGQCECSTGFTGASCNACAAGYYGPTCLACPGGATNPCSGHGTCSQGMGSNGT